MDKKEEVLKIKLQGKEFEYILIKQKIKNIYIRIKYGKIIVKSPKRINLQYIENLLKNKEKWILQKLKESNESKLRENKYSDFEFEKIVLENINKYASILGVSFNKIRIKNIKYAWGSCTSNKNITINYELIKYEEEIIKYVIVHELCHLKYMNHSKEFWKLVEVNIPDYKELRKKLKN